MTNLMIIGIVGTIASILAVVLDIPQLWKIFKTKNVSSFAISFLILRAIMIATWLVYGILQHDTALIATNAICTIASLLYFTFYFRYKK